MTAPDRLFTRVAKRLEGRVRYWTRPARDGISNWLACRGSPRFLVLRHRVALPSYYREFLGWLGKELPEVRALFELSTLPCRISDWSRYALLIPWFPDPFIHECKPAYLEAKALEARCRGRGVPVINAVDQILGASKLLCARRLAQLGIRTPHTEPIDDAGAFTRNLAGLRPPLLVREDRAHAGRVPAHLIEKAADAKRIPWQRLKHPIAVEFIDVRSPRDGLYRKYRYFAAGDDGLAHMVYLSRDWEVRKGTHVYGEAGRMEQIAFSSSPDPNHVRFQQARRAMGLDFVAFDYSYDREGRPVVWEANVLPSLHFSPDPQWRYFFPAVKRAMATTARMYFERAGLPSPACLQQFLETLNSTCSEDAHETHAPSLESPGALPAVRAA